MMRGISCSLLLLTLCAGCTSYEAQEIKEQKEENQIASILGQLQQEKINLATYRSVVEQLNSYYDHQGISKQIELAAADEALLRQMLTTLNGDFEKARRIDEVKNRFYNTLSDASYLDSCLLFRDAYRALLNDMGELPSKNNQQAIDDFNMALVKHVHGWTMRQVALRNNPSSIKDWPAHEVLRLGSGNAEDRLRVFMMLLNQSDVDSCAVVIKTQVRQDNVVENRQTPILAGVLIGKSVYLFDPYTGQPVPGPTAGTIATYEQLKKQPALMATRPDAPTATQLTESELVLMTPVNALAPRMAVLEKNFEEQQINVKLKDDAAGRIERFKLAGNTVKAWAAPSRQGYPGLVFQNYVEAAKGDPRLNDDVLPHARLVPEWALQAEKQIGLTGTTQSFLYEFDRLFVRLRLEPGGGRDLLVRGKPHQAIASLSQLENRLDRLLDMFHKDVTFSISSFREGFVVPVVQKYLELRQGVQQLNTQPRDTKESQDLQRKCSELMIQLQAVWKDQGAKSMIANLGAEWAIPEVREHITYFMGLSKMELAVRAEMRFRRNPKAAWPAEAPTPAEQYAAASEWFRRYEALVIPMKTNVWLDAVKLRHQECIDRQAELNQLKVQGK
ncbi:MAG: hypothetical protein QM703_16500 [Gemmatales bacterium]